MVIFFKSNQKSYECFAPPIDHDGGCSSREGIFTCTLLNENTELSMFSLQFFVSFRFVGFGFDV